MISIYLVLRLVDKYFAGLYAEEDHKSKESADDSALKIRSG